METTNVVTFEKVREVLAMAYEGKPLEAKIQALADLSAARRAAGVNGAALAAVNRAMTTLLKNAAKAGERRIAMAELAGKLSALTGTPSVGRAFNGVESGKGREVSVVFHLTNEGVRVKSVRVSGKTEVAQVASVLLEDGEA